MDTSMTAALDNDALLMTIWQRKPEKVLILHMDCRPVLLKASPHDSERPWNISEHELKGNCWDNATSESFFSTLKRELVELNNFADQKQAAAAVFEYIKVFYNKIRAHSTIGHQAPAEFEEDKSILKKLVR